MIKIKFLKRLSLALITFLFFSNTYGQKSSFKGQIIDENNNPIAYAHISIKDSFRGTLSNQDGEFRLSMPYSSNNLIVIVSCIGYETKEIRLHSEYETIRLNEDITQLREVVVYPRDYAKELIIKSIENIKKNYPVDQEDQTGFFREKTYWNNDTVNPPIYLAEGVIKLIKKSYSKITRQGNVKLIKGRNFKSPGFDSLDTKIHAGIHSSHRFDIVARRSEFLRNPNKYSYQIIDTARYEDQNLYKVMIKGIDTFKAFVDILDSSYALVKAKLYYDKFSQIDIFHWQRRYLDFTVEYTLGKDQKWRLKRIIYNTAFNKKQGILNLNSQFIATNYNISEGDIPYPERILYGDVFLDKIEEYDSSFWEENIILLPDSTTEALFAKPRPKKSSIPKEEKASKWIKVLNKISVNYEVSYMPIDVNSFGVSFSNNALSLSQNITPSSVYSIGLATGLRYQLPRAYNITLSTLQSFSKHKVESYDLELSKRINLNPGGRPWSLFAGLQLGHQKINYFLGDFNTNNTFSINGKDFDSGKTEIYLQERGFRVSPALAFEVEIGRLISLRVSSSLRIPITHKKGLYFEEQDQFFLKLKNTFLESGSENMNFTGSNNPLNNQFYISFGINYKIGMF